MERFSVAEVIEQSIQTERLGYEFYTKMAKRFKQNEEPKKIFEILAGQELRHEKIFSELKKNIATDELANWEEVTQYLRAIVESEFFLGKNKSLPLLEHVETTSDAVDCAIRFEKETLLYFYALRDLVEEREVVNKIIDEEKSHIIWLNDFKKNFLK